MVDAPGDPPTSDIFSAGTFPVPRRSSSLWIRRRAEIVPIRLVWTRSSGWDRLRRRLRIITSHERFHESVVTVLTLVLLGVFVAGLHHAIQPSQLPIGYAVGTPLR